MTVGLIWLANEIASKLQASNPARLIERLWELWPSGQVRSGSAGHVAGGTEPGLIALSVRRKTTEIMGGNHGYVSSLLFSATSLPIARARILELQIVIEARKVA